MKPNFALSLSFDGIRLLHRVSGGWHLVGEAAFAQKRLRVSVLTAISIVPQHFVAAKLRSLCSRFAIFPKNTTVSPPILGCPRFNPRARFLQRD